MRLVHWCSPVFIFRLSAHSFFLISNQNLNHEQPSMKNTRRKRRCRSKYYDNTQPVQNMSARPDCVSKSNGRKKNRRLMKQTAPKQPPGIISVRPLVFTRTAAFESPRALSDHWRTKNFVPLRQTRIKVFFLIGRIRLSTSKVCTFYEYVHLDNLKFKN